MLQYSQGADTPAGVLTLLFYHLLSDRTVYNHLKEELDTTFSIGEIGPEDHASLLDLPYLSAVVQEGLRLSTPFPGLARVVPKDGVVLVNRYIPGGTIVSVPAYAQEVSPENFWPAPLEFRPERWLEGGLGPDSILRPGALICFSFGGLHSSVSWVTLIPYLCRTVRMSRASTCHAGTPLGCCSAGALLRYYARSRFQ